MRAVGAEVLDVVFAGAVLVLFGSAAAVVAGRLSRAALLTLGGIVSAAALAAWVVVALDPGRERAVAAAGITVCAAAQLGLVILRRLVQQGRDVDASLAAARDELDALVRRETENRAAELERTLTLARAQSLSRLVEEERRMAEERRVAVNERERQANAELGETLTKIQARIGARLGEWTADLQRSDQELSAQIASLRQRQEQLLAEAAARLGLETERLETVSEEQQERLAALAAQFERVARETAESAHSAIDTHESERRRALQEVAERLRERERELRERIGAEEAEAIQRIQAGFADVEAQSVLAERLAHVADAGGQRLERKLSQIGTSLEQEQGELTAELKRRIRAAEDELRSQVQELAADAEAERTVLSARLNELQRRVDALLGQAEARTATFRSG